MDVKDLARESWDEIGVHHLSDEQIQELANTDLLIYQFSNPANYSYGEHSHPQAQALLLLRGELHHISGGRRYTQHPGDLLIVPAHVKHTAEVGPEGIDALLIMKKSI